MLFQITLGTALLIVSICVAGLSFWMMEIMIDRMRGWLVRPPYRIKLMSVLVLSSLWIMAQMTVSVWMWAFAFLIFEVFETLEMAVYFSLVAFTTLGFGDVLLPQEWRLLSGIAAANGLLNIGIVTAFLVEGLRQVRLQQLAHRETRT